MRSGAPMIIELADGDGDGDGDAGDGDGDGVRDAEALDGDVVRPTDGDWDAVVIPAEHAAREMAAAQAVTATTLRRIGVIIGCLPALY